MSGKNCWAPAPRAAVRPSEVASRLGIRRASPSGSGLRWSAHCRISRSYGLPSLLALRAALASQRSSNSSSCTARGSAEQRVFLPPLSEQLPTPHLLQGAHSPIWSEGRGSSPASAPTIAQHAFLPLSAPLGLGGSCSDCYRRGHPPVIPMDHGDRDLAIADEVARWSTLCDGRRRLILTLRAW